MSMYSFFVRSVTFPLLSARDGRMGVFKYLHELEDSQYLSPAALEDLQFCRLQKLLVHAYHETDFYRERFDQCGLDPSKLSSPDELRRVPLLSKSDIRDNQSRLLAGNYRPEDLHSSESGGTTGVRMTFYRDNRCLSPKAAATIRHEKWTGWNIGERAGLVWPARQDYVGENTLKAKIRNALSDRYLTLPAAVLTEEAIRTYCDRLQKLQPTKIRGFPNSLYPVANYICQDGHYSIRPKGVVATGEPLYPHQRECLEKAFNCPVFDSYGSRETGLIAQECEEHECMHLNQESLYVEFIKDDGSPARDGELGEIIVTDLLNYGMPMIRYSLGDLGIPTRSGCPCGRGLALIGGIQGRVADEIHLPSGRKISPASLVLYLIDNGPPVGQVQIVQEALDRFKVRFTNDPPPGDEVFSYYTETARGLLGEDVKVSFEIVDDIPKEPSGKYRYVKSLLYFI